jgi:hypothetical protein
MSIASGYRFEKTPPQENTSTDASLKLATLFFKVRKRNPLSLIEETFILSYEKINYHHTTIIRPYVINAHPGACQLWGGTIIVCWLNRAEHHKQSLVKA